MSFAYSAIGMGDAAEYFPIQRPECGFSGEESKATCGRDDYACGESFDLNDVSGRHGKALLPLAEEPAPNDGVAWEISLFSRDNTDGLNAFGASGAVEPGLTER
ncbi:hypothetical protein [Microvirga rosea]|uniref:hypothetical protein n=1 Tax=Microvirga rosea TaxID=2715425 RepID=UPI001D0A3F94|nr:hypothetical protein [Microvirga rosea]MCB8821936.1 hypothetical protein [Microvirga rosea]